MPDYFTIKQLTDEFGVSARALRFYESEGLLSPERRGRRRLFRPGDRTRIMLILRGKRLGFSLAEIREIIEMYGKSPGEAGQLKLLLDKIRTRRAELLGKLSDIELTLREMADVERQCESRLRDIKGRENHQDGAE